MILKLLLLPLCFLLSFLLQQDNVEMAFSMRESGKIYVVVGVLILIFLGIVVYLLNVERKIKKLEKRKEDKK